AQRFETPASRLVRRCKKPGMTFPRRSAEQPEQRRDTAENCERLYPDGAEHPFQDFPFGLGKLDLGGHRGADLAEAQIEVLPSNDGVADRLGQAARDVLRLLRRETRGLQSLGQLQCIERHRAHRSENAPKPRGLSTTTGNAWPGNAWPAGPAPDGQGWAAQRISVMRE